MPGTQLGTGGRIVSKESSLALLELTGESSRKMLPSHSQRGI